MFWGYLLIIVGLVLLLKNLGILTTVAWEIMYPAVIILIGLAIIFKKKKHKTDSINIE